MVRFIEVLLVSYVMGAIFLPPLLAGRRDSREGVRVRVRVGDQDLRRRR